MSDLISRSALFEQLRNENIPFNAKINEIIRSQPTAYDIEKVVAELETLRIDKSNYFGVLNVVAEKYDRANEMLDDSIDIVRKGGVE